MGNHEAGAAPHENRHGLLNQDLCTRIDGAGRLIENHDRAVREDGPGNGQKLPLSLGQIRRPLLQPEMIPARQGVDKGVCSGRPGRFHHLFISCPQSSVTDIFHDAAGKQPRILKNQAEYGPEVFPRHLPDIYAAHADFTVVHIIEAQQQIDQGGFSCTGGADDSHLASWLHFQTHIVHQGVVRQIPKFYMDKFH